MGMDRGRRGAAGFVCFVGVSRLLGHLPLLQWKPGWDVKKEVGVGRGDGH